MNIAAEAFLKERYYLDGEDWDKLCRRVAKAHSDTDEEFEEFYKTLYNCDALPNSPVLMNSGKEDGYLSACNLVEIPDDLWGIFMSIAKSGMIQKQGGGVGFNFSKLRPNGDVVGTTGGASSGVVSFLKGIDATSAMVKQGGKRRGANMGLLAMWHPDIMEFIQIKHNEGVLETFNLSVGITGELFDRADKGEYITFRNPRNGEAFAGIDPRRGTVGAEFRVDKLLASEFEQRIAQEIWHGGEPGLLFWDTIQKHNTTPWLGNLQGVNPCGEVSLLYNESCCLGSINLVNHLKQIGSEMKIDYEKLENTTRIMVRFLNKVIDNNVYPFEDMKEAAHTTKKIGLGIMGFADMLLEMGVEYGGKRCMHLITYIMTSINRAAKSESRRLGDKLGAYPAWQKGAPKQRNANLLSIAPTGSISWIAGVSSGIEPVFDYAYMMRRKGAEPIIVVNKPFIRALEFDDDAEKEKVIERLVKTKLTPNQMIELGELDAEKYSHFVTAKEVLPETHIRVQAAFQRFVDLSISKTINLPYNTTVEEIRRLIRIAYRFGCKGLTLYRDGSHREAFLQDVACPNCDSNNVVMAEGCMICLNCKTTLCINA